VKSKVSIFGVLDFMDITVEEVMRSNKNYAIGRPAITM
jgi:hypothetical protein